MDKKVDEEEQDKVEDDEKDEGDMERCEFGLDQKARGGGSQYFNAALVGGAASSASSSSSYSFLPLFAPHPLHPPLFLLARPQPHRVID